MTTWIAEFTLDKNIVQKDIIEAPDYTKAYFEILRKYPITVEILNIEAVTEPQNADGQYCIIPDYKRKVNCLTKGGFGSNDTS